MSAQSLDIHIQQPVKRLPVSFRFLLSLYGIVPICLLLVAGDALIYHHALRDWLPNSPGHFLLFQLFFGTPHIIASNLLLVSHQDYVQCFRQKLLGMTAFIIVFFGIGSLWIPYRALYVISACWTVYHVLKQQIGIAKAACRLPNWGFYLQLWLSVGAGCLIYLGVFLNNSLEEEQSRWILWLASVLSIALVPATMLLQRYTSTPMGRGFLWANTLLVVGSWLVYLQQYWFLAILMPRLVHDITAYSFYVSHDVNRHGDQPDTGLFRLARSCRIPPQMVLPLLSFLLTYLLQAYGNDAVNFITQTLFATEIHKAVTLGLIGYLALMHYYTESFVWSAGSPLRRYIRFSGL